MFDLKTLVEIVFLSVSRATATDKLQDIIDVTFGLMQIIGFLARSFLHFKISSKDPDIFGKSP